MILNLILLGWIGPVFGTSYPILLPDENARSNRVRDSALFLIQGSSETAKAKEDQWDLGHLPAPLEKSFNALRSPLPGHEVLRLFNRSDVELDVAELYQQRSRKHFHQTLQIPDTTQDLLKLSTQWKKTVIDKSEVKGLTRVLYSAPDISIAQTLETEDGDLAAPIRETEVIAKREHSPNWDFYVYDSDGKIALRSTFRSARGKDIDSPVPTTCMACHYNSQNRHFTEKAGK